MKHVVKRKGHSEPYDVRKLYASIYNVCLSVRTPEGEAELVADRVVKHVSEWLEKKHEVTAHDIRVQATKHLAAYNTDAAYLYKVHRDLIH
jgi:transcriptional regulator NrdR family protein